MSVYSVSIAPDNSTDANFRAWGKAVSDGLATAGWVKDTVSLANHVNWATVTRPLTAFITQGWEVWKMNDSLQATVPVFLKIEYGSGSPANYPALFITVNIGGSCDAAGNLSGGISSSRWQLYRSGTTTTYASRFVGTSSRFLMYMFQGSSTYAFLFSVERTHDASGADTGEGVLIFLYSGAYSNAYSLYMTPTTYGGNQTLWNTLAPTTGTGAVGADIAVYPVRAWGLGETSPSVQIFTYFNADLTSGVPVTATLWYGGTATILPVALNQTGTYNGGTTVIAIRYD